MSEAMARLLAQAVAEACGPAVAAARDEGFAAGVAEGRAQATREMRVRLKQMLVGLNAAPLGGAVLLGNAAGVGAVPAIETGQNRRQGGSSPSDARAPGPAPAAEAGPAAPAGEGRTHERVPSPPVAAAPGASLENLARARAASAKARSERGCWTAERKARLVEGWPQGIAAAALHAELSAMPGPPMPPVSRLAIVAFSLGVKRPPGFSGTRDHPVAAANAARGVQAARERVAAALPAPAAAPGAEAQTDERLFASFSSEKEGLPSLDPAPIADRKCLRCRRMFTPPGKHYFSCNSCNKFAEHATGYDA